MMGKKRVVIPLLLLGLLALGLALAYAERRSIATYAAKHYLAGLGIEDPRLEVIDLSLERVEVTGLDLGGAEGLNAKAIRLDFAFLGGGLIPDALDLKQVEIDGLRLLVNLTGDGPLLPGLEPLLAGPEEELVGLDQEEDDAAPLIAFDPLKDAFEVMLTDSRLTLATNRGPINALLDSQIERDDHGGMTVQVSGRGNGPGGRADGEARLSFQDERLTRVQADLELTDFVLQGLEPEALFVSLEADDYSLALFGDLLLPDSYLGGSALLEGDEPIVPLAAPPGDVSAWLDLLLDKDWTLQGQLAANNLSRAGIVDGLSLDTTFNMHKEGRRWAAYLPEHAVISSTRIRESSVLERLPPELLTLAQNPLELTLSAPEGEAFAIATWGETETPPLPIRLHINGAAELLSALSTQINLKAFGSSSYMSNPQEYNIDINSFIDILNFKFSPVAGNRITYRGRVQASPGKVVTKGHLEALDSALTLDDRSVRLSAQDASLHARLENDRLSLLLGRGLSVEAVDAGLPLERPGGSLSAAIERLDVALPLAEPTEAEADAEILVEPGTLLAAGLRLDHETLVAKIEYAGGESQADLSTGGIGFPDLQVFLDSPSLSARWGDTERSAELIAGVRDRSGSSRFPPLGSRLSADLSDLERIPVAGTLTGLDNRLKITLQGAFAPETGDASLRAVAEPLLFAPGGVQPAALHPLLARMDNAQGELRAKANLRLSNGNLNSSGIVSLKNASFTTPLGAYKGFNSEITLSSLWPPRTKPGQELSIDRVEIEEFPFEEVIGRFHLAAPEDAELGAGLPDVVIERAQLIFAEGLFRVRDMRVRPLSENQDSVIEVESLDLTRLFELLDIADVTASGRMSGIIPISLRGDGVLIEDAYLAADGPGILNIRSAEAQAALLPADDYIGELVDALEDFHYELLTIGVDKPLAGNTIVTMRILGRNPEVLHGTSFDLNVNLETDLSPVLRALSDAQDLREELESGFIKEMR